MRETCWWNLGTTYRRQALVVCEGTPPAARSTTGHPRNKQNGSEECPRSSYHAGRGHPVQGGRRPIMKMPFRVLVWPNLLIEAIKSRAGHLGQLSPRS